MELEHFDASDAFFVAGPSIRTSFERAGEDIGAFWGRCMGEAFLKRLPYIGVGDVMYAVYCDYESDYRGAYTMVLGVPVDAQTKLLEHSHRVEIPRGRYARLAFSGEPKTVVWGAWKHVNEVWNRRGQRRYAADFERYSLAAFREKHVEGEVVVGLR